MARGLDSGDYRDSSPIIQQINSLNMNQPMPPESFPGLPDPFRYVLFSNSFQAIVDHTLIKGRDRRLVPPPSVALLFSFQEYICGYEQQQRYTACQQPECAVFPQCDRSQGIAGQRKA